MDPKKTTTLGTVSMTFIRDDMDKFAPDEGERRARFWAKFAALLLSHLNIPVKVERNGLALEVSYNAPSDSDDGGVSLDKVVTMLVQMAGDDATADDLGQWTP